jgi:hypothetical protein
VSIADDARVSFCACCGAPGDSGGTPSCLSFGLRRALATGARTSDSATRPVDSNWPPGGRRRSARPGLSQAPRRDAGSAPRVTSHTAPRCVALRADAPHTAGNRAPGSGYEQPPPTDDRTRHSATTPSDVSPDVPAPASAHRCAVRPTRQRPPDAAVRVICRWLGPSVLEIAAAARNTRGNRGPCAAFENSQATHAHTLRTTTTPAGSTQRRPRPGQLRDCGSDEAARPSRDAGRPRCATAGPA